MIPITILLFLFSFPEESLCHNSNNKKYDKKSGINGIIKAASENSPLAFVPANQTKTSRPDVSTSTRLSTHSVTKTSLSFSTSKVSSFLFGTRISRPKNQIEAIIPKKRTSSFSSSSLYQSTKHDIENDENTKNNSNNELPSNFPRRKDAMAAITAVRKACAITRQIQPLRGSSQNFNVVQEKGEIATVTKADLSPVTVGDFASQAVILHHLHSLFPLDSFIAEESSEALEQDDVLADTIFNAIRQAADSSSLQNTKANVESIDSIQELMESIDLGQTYNSDGSAKYNDDENKKKKRVWCLDPIDGTKGFLRGKLDGGQYAVALALLEDGKPTIGILGCPNLPVSTNDDQYEWAENETNENNIHSRGCIFVASKGGGCYQLPLFPKDGDENSDDEDERNNKNRVYVTPADGSVRGVDEARFCVGVEKSIADALGQANAIATTLHGPNAIDPATDSIIQSRRMDSQAKYAVLARSGAEIYLRLPKPGYVEWIWDHAAGSVVITEAGGQMTDVDGKEIDFSLGAKLSPNVRGIVGTNGGVVHEAVLDAYRELSKEEGRE